MQTTKNKTLIVYASFGQGHMRAAQAVAEPLGVRACDLLDFCHPGIKKIYQFAYLASTKDFPWAWRLVFSSARNKAVYWLVNRINRILFCRFFKYISDSSFDIIILTHFFPAHLIRGIKPKSRFKVICIVTDLDVHPFWLDQSIDYYFTTLDESKDKLAVRGIDPQKIITGFVPIRRGFFLPQPQERLAQKFNLSHKPTLLFVSSSRGDFPFLEDALPQLLKEFNLFVIYGENKRLKVNLEKFDSPCLKYFYGYEDIWELMSLAAVIVTKPGGLTIFEGVALRKPFVFTHYIPGQEEENMNFLINKGLARKASSRQELLEAVNYFSKASENLKNDYPLIFRDIVPPLSQLIKSLNDT